MITYNSCVIYEILYTIQYFNTGGAVLSKFCIDGGARVRFADIFSEIAETFPEEKLDQLKDLINGKIYLGLLYC